VSQVTLEQIQDEAAHIQGLMNHPGWGIVADEATERIKRLTVALVAENEIEKIRDLQANIRSLQFLLKFPSELVEAARRATDEAPREDA
jgi:hypothetical protein